MVQESWFQNLRQVYGCLWNEGCAGFLLVKLKLSDFRKGADEKRWPSLLSLWVLLPERMVLIMTVFGRAWMGASQVGVSKGGHAERLADFYLL